MFTLYEIAQACGGKLIGGQSRDTVTGISCDSRTVQPGELFIALRGERFDGHSFLAQTFQKGAVCALIEKELPNASYPVVFVSDTLKAFQRLARYYRAQFSVPTIAVTGSAGKTTTKECIGVCLSEVFRVRLGYGNWNNHIGVPLNLFKLSKSDQCLVLELGANHPGEIALLTQIAQPTVGVITGIYPVHLEGFGSLEGIYKAKLELADYLDRVQGTIIANGDDPELIRRLSDRRSRLVTFGTRSNCDYILSDLVAKEGIIYFRVNEEFEFRLRGYGAFNAMNALGAIATAAYFNLDLKSLSESWQALPSIAGRFRLEWLEGRDVCVVDDSYNANPKSFERALESFQEVTGLRRKIIVAGDMLELGNHAPSYHTMLGRMLAEQGVDVLIGVGPLSKSTVDEFMAYRSNGTSAHVKNAQEATQFLAEQLKDGDAVFIKGSHGIKLNEVKGLLERYLSKTSTFA